MNSINRIVGSWYFDQNVDALKLMKAGVGSLIVEFSLENFKSALIFSTQA